jgi:hypothetical protein
MVKRSITDEEVALIKAMLARGMKNKDIQFFFNRPDRPVNSGRITGIRNGSYGKSNTIDAATDDELDTFVASQPTPGNIGGVMVPGGSHPDGGPLTAECLSKFFAPGPAGLWRLTGGETDRHECKANFGFKHQEKWLRAVAALANNDGGYVFFGVHDKDTKGPLGEDLGHAVVGMDTEEFQNADPADFAKRIKAIFDPTPQFQTQTTQIGGKTIGVIYVHRHPSRPVIATKQEGSIREGDIFFRYPGQSSRIKYSDLRALLDARDAEARSQMLPMLERLLQSGPRRSMVVDLEHGTLGDGKAAIHIDEALVKRLTFIKEGEFTESEGAPTLRLIGEVQPISETSYAMAKLGLLTRDNLLNAFLDQIAPDDPKLYIRFAIEVGQGEWLPLHYFAKLAGFSRVQLEAFINATGGTTSRKKTYIARVQPNAAFHAAIGSPKSVLTEILAGNLPEVSTAKEASNASQAIQALPNGTIFKTEAMLALLKECLILLAGKPTMSFARRAICRVDELLFAAE